MTSEEQSKPSAAAAKTSLAEARDQFQTWIDALGAAFRNDDYDYYERHVIFPLTVKTDAAVMTVHDSKSLEESFGGWSALIRNNHIDKTVHDITDIAVISDSYIACMFDTTFYAGAEQIMPTFRSVWEIEKRNDTWHARTIMNGMKNIKWPIRSPIFVPDEDGRA